MEHDLIEDKKLILGRIAMFEMLFTVTFFTGFIILLRCVCKNHISAGLRYAIWLDRKSVV